MNAPRNLQVPTTTRSMSNGDRNFICFDCDGFIYFSREGSFAVLTTGFLGENAGLSSRSDVEEVCAC